MTSAVGCQQRTPTTTADRSSSSPTDHQLSRSPGSPSSTGDLDEAIETARSAAGGKNLEILGADLASQCLRRGLVDEVLVYVLPVLMGDGVRFSTSGLGRIDLDPVEVAQSGPVTMLRFQVRDRDLLQRLAATVGQ